MVVNNGKIITKNIHISDEPALTSLSTLINHQVHNQSISTVLGRNENELLLAIIDHQTHEKKM